jgi:hypothetical protein
MGDRFRRALGSLALLLLFSACSSAPVERGPQRIGVPPDLQKLFAQWNAPGRNPTMYVALRPYERARDLEVLLFSTGSPVFSGILLPGRWVPVIQPWSRPIDARWLEGVRPDVAACVSDSSGAFALPVTLDGVVMLYRSDWWREENLPAPSSLAALRDGLLTLRSKGRVREDAVISEVPVEQLFWGLAWSYEGQTNPTLYSYPKVHSLRFIQEFNLVPRRGLQSPSPERLLESESAVLFTTARRASSLLALSKGKGIDLSILPLPGQEAGSLCIYNGWCMASPRSGQSAPSEWGRYTSKPFQRYLQRHGWQSVLSTSARPSEDPVERAMSQTRFYPAPRLGDQGEEIVTGAILDATQGPMTAEEALRRAQARIGR